MQSLLGLIGDYAYAQAYHNLEVKFNKSQVLFIDPEVDGGRTTDHAEWVVLPLGSASGDSLDCWVSP
jgi:hypothetical protein